MPARKTDRLETVTHWKNEAKRNRIAAEAMIALGGGTAPLVYLGALGCTQYVALHGVAHGQNGYRMGVGHPAAQALIRAEQRHLERRARMLMAKLDTIVGESADEPLSGSEPLLDNTHRADSPRGRRITEYGVFGDDKGNPYDPPELDA